jgi:hypothetical protein
MAATGGAVSPPGATLPTLSHAAQQQQAALAAARSLARQQALTSSSENAAESADQPSYFGPEAGDFSVQAVERKDGADWGQLREKSAENLTKGRTEGVSEEYRRSVEAYFRVLAERARKAK